MKKIKFILIGLMFVGALQAQTSNSYTYPLYIGKIGTSTGAITLRGTTSGTIQLTTPATGGNLLLNGDLGSTGTRVTKGWFTDIDISNAISGSSIYSLQLKDTTYTEIAYTLVLADADNWVTFNAAAKLALTIPPNADVAFPVGTTIYLLQAGGGGIAVTAGAGVTLKFPKDSVTLNTQYRSGFIRKWATNKWVGGGFED